MSDYAKDIETINGFLELNRHRDNMKFNQALHHAIEAMESLQGAEESLPEKKDHTELKRYADTDYVALFSFNVCLDEVRPIFAKLIQERDEARNAYKKDGGE